MNPIRILPACLMVAAPLAAQAAGDACHGIRPPSGVIGIGQFQCASNCVVNERGPSGYTHRFGTEPSVWEIEPGSPAAGHLRDGDVIVSIDGVLTTTAEGGRRMANLTPGNAVSLRIRRGGTESTVALTPVPGCDIPALWVHGSSADRSPQEVPRDIDFGMQLQCDDCGWRSDQSGRRAWFSAKAPVVVSVAADGPAARAGVRAGDVLTSLNQASFVAPAGSSEIASVRAGRSAELLVLRNGAAVSLRITPRSPPPGPRPF